MSPKLLNILLILFPVALYLGYIDPVYSGTPGLVWTPESSIFALQSQKIQYENSIAQVDLIESEMTKINKSYLDLNKDIKTKVETMLPDNLDPFKIRNEVTSIANKNGLAVSGLKVVDVSRTKDPKIGGYKIMFSVKSNYVSLKKLVEEYEKSLRFFVVESVTISHSIKKDEGGNIVNNDNDDTLDTSISFEVYYLRL
jgi:hypothetical protein